MATEAATISVYCRDCGYPLELAAEASRCSECGRPYDPGDERTYDTTGLTPTQRHWVRLTDMPAFWLLVGSPVLGLTHGWAIGDSRAWLYALLVAIISVVWYRRDCEVRRIRPTLVMSALVFFLSVVMIPIHLLATRGVRAFPAIGIAAALLIGSFGLYAGGVLLVRLVVG